MSKSSSKPVDLYTVLQVRPDASTEVIKAAYKALMRLHHPDSQVTAGETAVRLNQAHAVLTSPSQRRAYDQSLIDRALAGKVVGQYRIVSQIAEGGFGKTYRAEHLLIPDAIACLKHCSEISPAHRQILFEEAKAMWGLHHYAIPAVRDVIQLPDESLALVMSYMPGNTLAQEVEQRGVIIPEDVAWIAQRVLDALAYIHAHGIVHGDLKPQNIILQPNSHNAILVDFGLSAIKPRATTRAKGYTDVFAAPEQQRGEVPLPEADLYSLGMTMIFLLTGGDVDATRARSVPASLPLPFKTFIRSLVTSDPQQRPQDVNRLLDTLTEVRLQSFGRAHSNLKPLGA
jgi:serine/threonine protein kinase